MKLHERRVKMNDKEWALSNVCKSMKKSIKASIRWGVLIVLMISPISSFSQDDEQFRYQYDMTSELFSRVPEETQRITFGDLQQHEPALVQGWGGLAGKRQWANATTATLSFYQYRVNQDAAIKITWSAQPSRTGKTQQAEIFLNDTQIDTLTVKASRKKIALRLPASALRPGFNTLTFQFSYTEQPKNLDSTSQKERNLAVAFHEIVFSTSSTKEDWPIQKADQGFLQVADTGVGVFTELPETFVLDAAYQSTKKTEAVIKIVGAQGDAYTMTLPPEETHVTETITLPQSGIYHIQTVTEGSWGRWNEHVLWKNVSIRTAEPRNLFEEFQEQGFVKSSKPEETKPDMLLYVIDTLRADHVGSYGYAHDTTPHIDAFAEENARYTRAYSTASWTKISGASIVSGLLPRNHQTMTRDEKLPDDIVTLTETLQEQGYYTVAFITNGVMSGRFGFNQGYDEFIVFKENHATNEIHVTASAVNRRLFRFLKEYLNTPARKPLFMLVWTTDPHDPYTPPTYAKNLFGRDQFTPIHTNLKLLTKIRKQEVTPTASQREFMKVRYDQEIFANDRSFGVLVDRLKKWGLYEDMTIIVTSDHGEEFFEHGGVGHGLTLYNEQIHVPFAIKTPRLEPKVYDHPIQLTDIYPTLLDVIGADAPYPLDGISLLKPHKPHRVLYFEENLDVNELSARMDSEKKLIFTKRYSRPPEHPEIPPFELYAAQDIADRQNLTIQGFADFFRIQQLIAYMTDASRLGLQAIEAEISPELDQELRDLGYVK